MARKITRKMKRKGGAAASSQSMIHHSTLRIEGTGYNRNIMHGADTVGFVSTRVHGHTYSIDNIQINYDYRSRGIGKFVLKTLLNEAFDNHEVNEIILSNQTQSDQFNPNKGHGRINNEMYTKCGFKYTTDRKSGYSGYWDDMVLSRDTYMTNKSKIHEYLDSSTTLTRKGGSKGRPPKSTSKSRSKTVRTRTARTVTQDMINEAVGREPHAEEWRQTYIAWLARPQHERIMYPLSVYLRQESNAASTDDAFDRHIHLRQLRRELINLSR
jgi:GNAT superfamily N-acetyltransferase